MPLRIPERAQPARVTIGDAFAYLVQRTIRPESAIGRAGDLAAAVYFAASRIGQRATLTAAQAQNSSPQLDFLDTDPLDIASTILEAVVCKNLTVGNVPDEIAQKWAMRPVVSDWVTGLVLFDVGGSEQWFYPTLDLAEIDALFAIKNQDVSTSASPEAAGPVAPAALLAVVRKIMASERLIEAEAYERAVKHFAPRTFSEALWRAAWKDEPNKFRRGEKPIRKSGA